jgi:hypothetical protein
MNYAIWISNLVIIFCIKWNFFVFIGQIFLWWEKLVKNMIFYQNSLFWCPGCYFLIREEVAFLRRGHVIVDWRRWKLKIVSYGMPKVYFKSVPQIKAHFFLRSRRYRSKIAFHKHYVLKVLFWSKITSSILKHFVRIRKSTILCTFRLR